jgi:hypothetical protein
MADFDFMNLFTPRGTPSGLDALFNDDQRKLMGRNANLSAAAALLQAGGRSRQRVGLGQALGAALQAGQQGYQQARAGSLQDLLLGEKLRESQRTTAADEAFRNLLGGAQPAAAQSMPMGGQMPMPTASIDGPGVQVFAPDAPVRPTAAPQAGIFSNLSQEQRALIGSLGREKGVPELLRLSQAGSEFGEARPVVINGQTVMVQTNKMGQTRIAPDMMPYEAQSPDVRAVEYLQGRPLAGTGQAGVSAVGQYRQQIAPKTDVKVNVPVDMTGGQKGFENEMKLGGSFKQEPIYKDFSDMKSSFSQVVSSLSAGTPIGDVAGATKIMKLLDPGSVVRESELAIAMQAAGRLDRLQNYFSNMMSGQKLTPTQRDDFKALSNELYAAAGQAYNAKRNEYEQFGNAYGFKNLGTALGPAASIPSVVRKDAAGGKSTGPRLERGPDGVLRYVP